MSDNRYKDLCISLVKADTESEIINILTKTGYWANDKYWRYYGNKESNFNVIGNQQSNPDTALVEKLINSVDAVLTRECLVRGIDPESETAPQNMCEALEKFFSIYEGKLTSIDARQRGTLAKDISLVATGAKSNPSYAVIDKGEGQSPLNFPRTFVSLNDRSNKERIHFVQGKFNMGSTGSLQFCGKNNLQLIVSKRNPTIASKEKSDPSNNLWGFTIIRREDPKQGMKSSTYRYLVGDDGGVMSFNAVSIPVLPTEYPEPYGGNLDWGTYIKLYEYQLQGYKSPVKFDLYYRLSLLIPNLALPITLYERRPGYIAESQHIVMSGLSVRIDEDKSNNIEPGFPSSSEINVAGEKIKVSVYVFKPKQAEKYSPKEGIVFVVNGQAHGFLPRTFFERKAVGMSYLKDSILLLVDCTDLQGRFKEDLFMNSRDRLRDIPLKKDIETALESLVKNHQGLKDLREKRRREEIDTILEDSQPLVDVINDIINKSPSLSSLLKLGTKISNPFNLVTTGTAVNFTGKKYPTYFKLTKNHDELNPKLIPINHGFRVQFETDAVNDYFQRDMDPGQFTLFNGIETVDNYVLTLWNGLCTLTIDLPEGKNIGDTLKFNSEVTDVNRISPFKNEFFVKIVNASDITVKTPGPRKNPPGHDDSQDRQKNEGLALPYIKECRKSDGEHYEFIDDEQGAIRVKDAGENRYDFYINMDNNFLRNEQKMLHKIDPKLLEARFKYGMVLIGLVLIKSYSEQKKDNDKSIYDEIYFVCKSLAPVLLPMISSLGSIDLQEA